MNLQVITNATVYVTYHSNGCMDCNGPVLQCTLPETLSVEGVAAAAVTNNC